MHIYEFPHPAVTTDIVIFTLQGGQLKVLLIQRAHAPYKDHWSLPGGFVEIDEDLEAAADSALHAVSLAPRSTGALALAADTLCELKDGVEAAPLALAALAADPTNQYAKHQLARSAALAGDEAREILPEEPKFTGFVFKIQANMDKNHRDRIAFVRICSGKYTRGMKVLHVRSGKTLALNNPVLFLARERELAEEAWPGDILGIPGHGHLRIGDSLTEGEKVYFTGIPSFAPELFQRVRLDDPLKSKQLKAALEQLSEEGASQIFKPLDGSSWIIGVVGALQFDVIASRLQAEYAVRGSFEAVQFTTARWLKCADKNKLSEFCEKNKYNTAEDGNGALAYLAPNAWHLTRIQQDFPDIEFLKTREHR
jgi:peptide subunit release factor RF-3